MKLTVAVTSCALLSALSLPLMATRAPAHEAAPIPASLDDEGTIVIRYDPEIIFLTHDLVAPLCASEVTLTSDSSDSPVGRLVLTSMESNALQPRGVFVGRVSIEWAGEPPSTAAKRAEVLDGGLDQLRAALTRRLVKPLERRHRGRVDVLSAMVDDLAASIDATSQLLLRSDELEASRATFDALAAEVRDADLQRRAAENDLLLATADVRKVEATLSAARTMIDQVSVDVARTQKLVDEGMVSMAELQALKTQLASSRSDLQQAEVQLDAERLRVDQRKNLLAALDARLDEQEVARTSAQERIAALADAADEGARLDLELRLELERARLEETGTELERARASLATITVVTIERW